MQTNNAVCQPAEPSATTAENTNKVYIFMPFKMKEHGKFRAMAQYVEESPVWNTIILEPKYMYKYVAEKIASSDPAQSQCFFCKLKDDHRAALGIQDARTLYTFKFKNDTYRFYLEEVQMHGFSTSVGILTFCIRFDKTDPLYISSAEFLLKKVSKTNVMMADFYTQTTLLDMAKHLTDGMNTVTPLEFFYFVPEGTERANVFSYVQVDSEDNLDRDMFFLRRCYSESYIYHKAAHPSEDRAFSLAKGIHWDVTSEAAACIACPSVANERFIRKVFTRNIHEEYLFMYIFLLHQRYVLYMFLSEIGVGRQHDLAVLEDYKERLYEFETNFVFYCVTEVSQYQMLYESVSEVFDIEKMCKDVREPLVALSELKRQKQEGRTNTILTVLSTLTLASVFADVLAFVQGIADISNWWVTLLASGGLAAACVAFWMVFRFNKNGRR